MKARRRKQSYMGQMINTGVGNIVGTSLIGATAGMVQGLPAGMARDIAGITPGLQATAMLGPNLKFVNDSLGINQPRRRAVRRRVRRHRY